MTEITEYKVAPPFDIIAFTAALICAPLVVTALTFVTVIPVFALIVGAPLYLVVGTPTLLWMVGRYPPRFAPYALAGLGAIFALMVLMWLLDLARPDLQASGFFGFLVAGAVFAPLWAGTFAPLYRWWNRAARPRILS